IGPTTYYNWMVSANTITTAVSLPLAGGLSDIFGRRWFLIVGNCFSLVGAIVSLAAQNVPMVIAGSAVTGLGSGAQQLALAAVAELVPNKHRGRVQACLDLAILPWTLLGALIGGGMVEGGGKLGWRINFILGVCLNVIALIMAFFWYYPPSYANKGNQGKSKIQAIKELDVVGVFLLNAGLLLILVGIALGGTTYPWNSAGFICLIAVGGACLIGLGVWEYKFAKHPFVPHDMFRGKARTFTLVLCITFVAGMGLYAAAAFWTQLCQNMWGAGVIKTGIYSIPSGVGGVLGGFVGGMVVGKNKYFSTNLCLVYGCIFKIAADAGLSTLTPYTVSRGLGISFLSMVGTGWLSVSLIVCVQLACEDKDIGLATLLLGAIRAVGGSVAITIYSTILNNKILKDGPLRIATAVVPKGLPLSSIEPFLMALQAQDEAALMQIPGITPDIIQTGVMAMRESFGVGFSYIYITSAAFAGAALIAALLTKDVRSNMTDNVAVRLENEKPLPVEDAVKA
ncbi:MFS general substrate transporter, partial [Aulographum hederae CBS 113979]